MHMNEHGVTLKKGKYEEKEWEEAGGKTGKKQKEAGETRRKKSMYFLFF